MLGICCNGVCKAVRCIPQCTILEILGLLSRCKHKSDFHWKILGIPVWNCIVGMLLTCPIVIDNNSYKNITTLRIYTWNLGSQFLLLECLPTFCLFFVTTMFELRLKSFYSSREFCYVELFVFSYLNAYYRFVKLISALSVCKHISVMICI